jgi:hypothetical protein
VLQVAIDHGEHDAAFEIYRKGGHKVEALTVLTDKCRDLNRAHEYATKTDDPIVWSTLGHKQLQVRCHMPHLKQRRLLFVCVCKPVHCLRPCRPNKYCEFVWAHAYVTELR